MVLILELFAIYNIHFGGFCTSNKVLVLFVSNHFEVQFAKGLLLWQINLPAQSFLCKVALSNGAVKYLS